MLGINTSITAAVACMNHKSINNPRYCFFTLSSSSFRIDGYVRLCCKPCALPFRVFPVHGTVIICCWLDIAMALELHPDVGSRYMLVQECYSLVFFSANTPSSTCRIVAKEDTFTVSAMPLLHCSAIRQSAETTLNTYYCYICPPTVCKQKRVTNQIDSLSDQSNYI